MTEADLPSGWLDAWQDTLEALHGRGIATYFTDGLPMYFRLLLTLTMLGDLADYRLRIRRERPLKQTDGIHLPQPFRELTVIDATGDEVGRVRWPEAASQ